MTDPYDTHDENNTPEDNGWDGNYPDYPGELVEDAAWDEFIEWVDSLNLELESDDEIPF